ncbi:hypothetical protein FQN57_000001 [Myotisia sp. PD_48]|nr:hypothetical protein FQN57_000001 [Myotisia sp. PD_48]
MSVQSSGAYRTLLVAGQQLSPYAHGQPARAVLALLGQDVLFIRGKVIDLTGDDNEDEGPQRPARRPRALIDDGSTLSFAILIE